MSVVHADAIRGDRVRGHMLAYDLDVEARPQPSGPRTQDGQAEATGRAKRRLARSLSGRVR
jgi:hypothetical protein